MLHPLLHLLMLLVAHVHGLIVFFWNRAPPRQQHPHLPPCPRPPPVCAGGGIPAVAGVVIVGAKFAVYWDVYGFIVPGLRYMFVGTGGGAAHVGGALHS